MATNKKTERKHERGAGVLLHISSLPSDYGIGTLGKEAYKFIDFLSDAGQKYWQVLPVGPTGFGDSPYSGFSAFAGNPYFVDLDILCEEGLLKKTQLKKLDWGDDPSRTDYGKIYNNRFDVLRQAYEKSEHKGTKEYKKFCKDNEIWLDDYAMFMALKGEFEHRCWQDWPDDAKMRKAKAMAKYKEELADEIDYWKFIQFEFFRQWHIMLDYAHSKKIRIIGDIPMYVSLDSADVWANPKQFQLDRKLCPKLVAGVPPDDFSEDGQLWGNPLYNWTNMAKDGYTWWKNRVLFASHLYDFIRIDHFIGIVKYFAVPAGESTARNGTYKRGPGKKLTDAINSVVDSSRFIAEDLGILVPAVERLCKENDYPGMKIMQFGFNGDVNNPHFPDNYSENMIIYGGTHDNEMIIGFFNNQDDWTRNYTAEYLGVETVDEFPWAMIKVAYESPSRTAIFQVQDILELDNDARMNAPATAFNNWSWRMEKRALKKSVANKLRKLAEKTERI